MNQTGLVTRAHEGVNDTSSQIQALRVISFVAYKTILPMICAFGILGNILNLLTLRSPALQAVSYMYLRALAVADLFCMLFVLLFVCRIAKILPNLKTYSMHYYIAHLELPIINFFIASGVLTIVALTVDRYVSVVWPMKFSAWNTPNKAKAFIFGAYFSCFLLYLPMCWQKNVAVRYDCTRMNISNDSTANTSCTNPRYSVHDDSKSKHNSFVAYKWIRETLLRLLPIVGLTYLNIHIIVKLRIVAKNRARMAGRKRQMTRESKKEKEGSSFVGGSVRSDRSVIASKQRQGRDDQRLLLLLTVIVVLFFICNLPAAVNLIFIKDTFAHDVIYQIFRATANVLEIANHAVNFYIFCCCSKDYRQEFLRTLKSFPLACYVRRFATSSYQYLRKHCRLCQRVGQAPVECDGIEQKALIHSPTDPRITSTPKTSENCHVINHQKVSQNIRGSICRQNSISEDKNTMKNCSENCTVITCAVTTGNNVVFTDFNLDCLPETMISNSSRLSFDENEEIFV